jgi:hypothetical protein
VSTHSEAASKELGAGYGVPVLDERIVADADSAVAAAGALGHPVAVSNTHLTLPTNREV